MNMISLMIILLLTCACNEVPIRNANLPVGAVSSTPTASPYFPIGAVVPFDAAVCPAGWTAFTPAKGRFILGAGVGNVDSVGGALTARVLDTSGGLEYTTGVPAVNAAGDAITVGVGNTLAGEDQYKVGSPDISLSGSATDANLPPYIVRLFCIKTSGSGTNTSGASVGTESASCGTGWSQDNAAKGFAFLGQGVGNNDALGNPLTARVLNVTGGSELTPDIPACTGVSDGTSVPDPTKCLTTSAAGNLYRAILANQPLTGVRADANMPPFYALLVCQYGSTDESVPSGTITAFDLAACPGGWSAYAPLAGRMMISVNDVGTATLSVRTSGQSGGLEYTSGLPSAIAFATTSVAANAATIARASYSAYKIAAPDTTIVGSKADSNMPPFYVLRYCVKD